VFGAPPWPVVLGADCVLLGPVAVDDVGLWWLQKNPMAATMSMTTTKAPMPHAARRPDSVDLGGGSVSRMPHAGLRAGPVDVRGRSVECREVIRRSCSVRPSLVDNCRQSSAVRRRSRVTGKGGGPFPISERPPTRLHAQPRKTFLFEAQQPVRCCRPRTTGHGQGLPRAAMNPWGER
jgi:hypothetical protein